MEGHSANNIRAQLQASPPVFPFTAIVGQDEMKLALLLSIIAPTIGGVLVMGHRGTAKSTAVRALASLLPKLKTARDCAYHCDPSDSAALCVDCNTRLEAAGKLKSELKAVPVVELPLGATEDRVCGAIDLARALREGIKAFEPGLLARANRGFLYIDEVNLLEDHLVDLLLDVAATGRNRVEREGISIEHPARFCLVGSGNPEEGELRPQLLDRFGLSVEVETVRDPVSRVRIIEQREAFDSDPQKFLDSYRNSEAQLRARILKASRIFPRVEVGRATLLAIAELCIRLEVDGHRGEITITRAARALAAFESRRKVTNEDVRRVAAMALRHRLRRDPLEQSGGGGTRVQNSVEELFGGSNEKRGEADLAFDEGRAVGHSGGAQAGNEDVQRGGRKSFVESKNTSKEKEGRGHSSDGEDVVVPTGEVNLKLKLASTRLDAIQRAPRNQQTMRRGGQRASVDAGRGQHVGATTKRSATRAIAPDATLRAAAQTRSPRNDAAHSNSFRVEPEDLRFKRFRAKAGALYIFLIDTSGSMALNRVGQAKGALAHLLRRSYINRERISLICFRDGGAQLLLAPSSSTSRARKILDELPVGGATPLAAGLERALEITRRSTAKSSSAISLIVFTDGRANVPLSASVTGDSASFKSHIREEIRRLGASLKGAGVASLVIDTQSRFTSNGEGRLLAEALGGRYEQLPQLISENDLIKAS